MACANPWHPCPPPCVKAWLHPVWADFSTEVHRFLSGLDIDEASWASFEFPEPLPVSANLPFPARGHIHGSQLLEWDCLVDYLAKHPPVTSSVAVGSLQIQGEPLGDSLSPPNVEQLQLGVADSVWSAMLAMLAARLVTGVWGVPVTFRQMSSYGRGVSLLESADLDAVLDVDENAIKTKDVGSLRDLGDLPTLLQDHLYVTVPPVSQHWLWNSLNETAFQASLPHKECTMGPWDTATSGLGVWCLPHVAALSSSASVPVIWASGPQTSVMPVSALMAFIHAQELTMGIEFLEPTALEKKLHFAAFAQRPAVALLRSPSIVIEHLQPMLWRMVLPAGHGGGYKCGDLGTWHEVGKWSCDFVPRRITMLARKGLHPAVETLLERFDLPNDDVHQMFHTYLGVQAAAGDQHVGLTSAVDQWVSAHEAEWLPWFTPANKLDLAGSRMSVFFCLLLLLLAYVGGELRRRCLSTKHPDKVNREQKLQLPLEILAGVMDTVNIMLRAVGMAAALCGSKELAPYQGAALMHVLVGHFIGQATTTFFSNYETPLCTPALELLPILKVVRNELTAVLIGHGSEALCVTVLVISASITLISGLMLYGIGVAGLGSGLRYLPYAVEIGVQGALGIVLLDLGLEAACGQSPIAMMGTTGLQGFFDRFTLVLWLPAIIAAAGLFFITKKVVDSPYNFLTFMGSSIVLFHLIRLLYGASIESARSFGWLYEPVDLTGIRTLYSLDSNEIYWGAIFEHLPAILVGVLIVSIINTACQLAVTPSLLPPRCMGESDFDSEIIAQGRSHIFQGLCGGFSSDFGNDDTLVHRMLGGRYRCGIYVHLASFFLCLLWGRPAQLAIPLVPKFVNATIILVAALEFLLAGVVHAYGELRTSEFAVVLVVVATVVVTGGRVELSLVAGTFAGFAEFVVRYSKTMGIMWKPAPLPGVAIAELQGYLYFATAPLVINELQTRLSGTEAMKAPQVLIVDWSHVVGIDTKGAVEFRRLDIGSIIFCGLEQALAFDLRRVGVLPKLQTPALVADTMIEMGNVGGLRCSSNSSSTGSLEAAARSPVRGAAGAAAQHSPFLDFFPPSPRRRSCGDEAQTSAPASASSPRRGRRWSLPEVSPRHSRRAFESKWLVEETQLPQRFRTFSVVEVKHFDAVEAIRAELKTDSPVSRDRFLWPVVVDSVDAALALAQERIARSTLSVCDDELL